MPQSGESILLKTASDEWMLRKPKVMNTRYFRGFSLGLALSVLPIIAGCNQQPASAPSDKTNSVSAQPTAGFAVAPDSNSTMAEELQPIPTPPTERPIPANIKPSPSLSEIIRLAYAGVEESLMLACVDNSQGTYNLGSDEIIYLTDLGVPDDVVTAMMDHDRFLKQTWAAASQLAAATAAQVPNQQVVDTNEQLVAAAPTYVDQPESYPVEEPAQVVNYNYFYDNLSPYG